MKTQFRHLSAAILLAAATASAADTAAPELVSIGIAPATVDVSSGSGPITVTLALTDDESGVAHGDVDIFNPAGQFVAASHFDDAQRISGSATDGTYEVVVTVPMHAGPGLWRAGLSVADAADHYRRIDIDGPNPFPVPAHATFTVVNNGVIDSQAPVVTASSATPATVSTGAGPADVTVTLECGDDLSGFFYGFVYVYEPGGAYRGDLLRFFPAASRLSGDKLAGTYAVTLPLETGSAEGEWTLEVFMTDEVGNAGFTLIPGFTVSNGSGAAGTLASALDAVHLPWLSSDPGWMHQTAVSHDGVDAAATEPLADEGDASLETRVTGPGTLSFHWRVDSEAFYDVLSVEVMGTDEYEVISGATGWEKVLLTIPEGEHTVVWTYSKDDGVEEGEDRGWVDEVRFFPEQDNSLPVLQALRVSPNPVDVSGGPRQVLFTLEVTDDFAGLAEGCVDIQAPGGEWLDSACFQAVDRVTGDPLAGTYEFTVEIPEDAEPGQWRVEVTLVEAGTYLSIQYGGEGAPFPVPGEEFFTVGASGAEDTEGPEIVEFSLVPATVDVSAGDGSITATLRITDDQAGFLDGSINVLTADLKWTGALYLDAGARISGDAFDGVYQLAIPIPRYGPPGTWRLECYVKDAAENERNYPTENPLPPGGDGTFAVVNNGSVDASAPVVTGIDIVPNVIDTSTAPATLGITVAISDDLSGIRDAFLFFDDPQQNGASELFSVLGDATRISGDAVSGIHQVSVTVPQGSAEGVWTVRVFLRDRVGRSNFYGGHGPAYPEPEDGKFTVGGAPPSTFKSFAAAHGLTGDDALPGADPDRDGRINAVELCQGTHPGIADPGSAWQTPGRDATHLHLDFTINPALAVTVSGNYLELRDGGGGPPLRVTGQTGTGLAGPWTEALPVPLGGNTWRVSLALAGGQGFVRLAFEDP